MPPGKQGKPDLSALKARVDTYEKELGDALKEGGKLGAEWQRLSQLPPSDEREAGAVFAFAGVMQFLGRRVDLMEKYEAALREYVAALGAKNAELEKELQKYKSNLVHYDGP